MANSYISDGDDNVAINGALARGANNISVVNNHFGDGHGASIGSIRNAGVSNVLFQNISFSGNTANRNQIALRIKSDVSRGSLVQNIAYRNLCCGESADNSQGSRARATLLRPRELIGGRSRSKLIAQAHSSKLKAVIP